MDDVAPAVVVADINLNGIPVAEAGSQQSVDVQFSEDVSLAIEHGWLELTNLTTGQVVPAGNIAVTYDSATNTAHFTFPGYANGVLPDGNYTGRIYAGLPDLFGNVMPADAPFEFFFLGGDANHDRAVDITDLGILATNWQGSDKLFSDGDFNYDGTVDITDLGMLATNWQVQPASARPDPTGTPAGIRLGSPHSIPPACASNGIAPCSRSSQLQRVRLHETFASAIRIVQM